MNPERGWPRTVARRCLTEPGVRGQWVGERQSQVDRWLTPILPIGHANGTRPNKSRLCRLTLLTRAFDGTTMQIIHEEPRPIDDQIIVSFEIRVS